MTRLYDCHTHVESKEELRFYYDYGIIPVINAASRTEYEQLRVWQSELEQVYDRLPIYYSIGIHPWRVDQTEADFGDSYEELVVQADFVGEIGMDSVWTENDLVLQEQAFRQSLDMAERLGKPVILHTKGQEQQILQIVREYAVPILVHWYSCADYVADYLALGAYFTIGPAVLTDPVVQDLVRQVPLERLLLETDGRSALEWLCDKSLSDREMYDLLEDTIATIASLKDKDPEQVRQQLEDNACIWIEKAHS